MTDMKPYIGLKSILAKPMTRAVYNQYRGWELPADENGDDEGFLVEYTDGGDGNHPDHTGYISWSPRAVFEKAYAASGSMNFSHALAALKEGKHVSRSGWNGKGMFIFLNKGSYPNGATVEFPEGMSGDDLEGQNINDIGSIDGVSCGLFDRGDDGTAVRLPNVNIRVASGATVTGWLASQTDMLAEDWGVVE